MTQHGSKKTIAVDKLFTTASKNMQQQQSLFSLLAFSFTNKLIW